MQKDLRQRIREFALRIIRIVASLPKNKISDVLGYQLLKSGTSIGANYREACRARSKADFISKIGIVEQETDETFYWLELLAEVKMIDPKVLSDAMKECEELLAIFVSSGKTAKSGNPNTTLP